MFLVWVTFSAFADDNQPFYFYLPVQDEVNAFFNLIPYLSQYNDDQLMLVDKEQFSQFFDIGLKYKVIQTYYLLDFIRNTKNQFVIDCFIEYCNLQNEIPIDYEQTLTILKQRENENSVLKNGKTIENVKYSDFVEIGLFENTLKTLLPDNEWQTISVNNKNTNAVDKNYIAFLCGGGTNSFLASYRYYNETESDFVKRVEQNRFDESKFSRVALMKLPVEDFLVLNNASKIYLWLGTSKDEFNIKNGQLVLYMYSEKYKRGYEITWLVNFSNKNVYYENPETIYSLISEIILFTWID